MKKYYVVGLFITAAILLIQACGKVSNETLPDKNQNKVVYYTTLVGAIPVESMDKQGKFYLTPSENTLIVCLASVNKDGTQSLLSWGKGLKEKSTTANASARIVSEYRSASYSLDNALVKKQTAEDILVKWVKGKPDKWEYYALLDSEDGVVYNLTVMNGTGTRMASIPLQGKAVSENNTVELTGASALTSLWSRIFIADESKNIVKKSLLTVDEIEKLYNESFLGNIKYKPADIRVKKFTTTNPKTLTPSENSVEYYLSEILVNQKKDPAQLNNYLNALPREVIPTAAINYIRTATQKK